MGDELGRLPRKGEVLARMLFPAFDRIGRGRAVEHAIELGGFKLAGVVLKSRFDGQAIGVEWSSPRAIMPAGCANQNAGHKISHCRSLDISGLPSF